MAAVGLAIAQVLGTWQLVNNIKILIEQTNNASTYTRDIA